MRHEFKFKVGDKVEVFLKVIDFWQPGTIGRRHESGGYYDIIYGSDGSTIINHPEQCIRFASVVDELARLA